MKRPWTPAEDDTLFAAYAAKTPLRQIAQQTGRSVPAIKHRATVVLGIGAKLRAWSADEITALRAGGPIDGRSPSAIHTKRKELGIAFPRRPRADRRVRDIAWRLSRTTAVEAAKMPLPLLLAKWEKQKGLCAYSGVPMTVDGDTQASVDRVDSALGYTDENTVLCCFAANWMKRTLSPEQLKWWCRAIADH